MENQNITKIDKSLEFDDLTLVKYLHEIKSPFLTTITNIFYDVTAQLDSRIPSVFPNYTLHNSGHSFRLINYMAEIVEDYKKLSELEITILILSALYHDVGMAVSEDDLENIRNDSFPFSDIKYSVMLRMVDGDQTEATQEYVRRIHAKLSGRYIRMNLKGLLSIPTLPHLDFTEELALICESHTESYDWILRFLQPYEIRGDYPFNTQYLACILRLADILDIDGNRTPYKLFKLISPKGLSKSEWQQHFVIFNNKKIITNSKTNLREIVFHGKSESAEIHRKILNYIDWVETEFSRAIEMTTGMREQYNLPFLEKPKINIQSVGYTFSGYKMVLQFTAVSNLLMGEKIYGSKSLGLRELVQNSFDACRIRQEKEIIVLGEDPYIPSIKVIVNEEKNEVIIKDNGIGMTHSVIKNHFLNIGVSFYQSREFLLHDYKYKPIGNYGIGFLSCFMLSDTVSVKTKNFRSKSQFLIQLEKGNEWTSLTESEEVNFVGTEVTLRLDQFMEVFSNNLENVSKFLQKHFLTDGVDFRLVSQDATIKISNNISDIEIEKGLTLIPLSDYITDFEGYALIRKKNSFISSMADIPFGDELYLYVQPPEDIGEHQEEWDYLKAIADASALDIEDYRLKEQIKYLSIPIIEIENEDDFLSGMKFTEDDVKEVIKKLDRKLRRITILFTSSLQEHLSMQEITNSSDFFKGLSFNTLLPLGQSERCSTYCFVETYNIFQGKANSLYLPFETNNRPNWHFWHDDNRKEIFIRSVLIKEFAFTWPVTTSIIEIESVVVNITSRKFIPDISRNNLDPNTGSLVNNLIAKAIYKASITHLRFQASEVISMQQFIDRFYPEKHDLEK